MPLHTRPAFVNKLHTVLTNNHLPGLEAHLRMAHAIRKVELPLHKPSREAAVLILLYEKAAEGFHVLLIKRTSRFPEDKHAGQIAFPGGGKESSDPDIMFTALREAQEETGIDLTQIDVLGSLTPLYIPVSKYLVHPFVGYSRVHPEFIKQDLEIEEVLEIPLAEFRSRSTRQTTQIALSKEIILNHVPCFLIEGKIIWGATAMIMNELLEILE
jgi:8-oxo-dGTP pyrophosphatase MutT (NUDIX family)